MVLVTFEEITRHVEKNGDCPVCGKKVKRKTKFINTLNPYNRNPDGSVRTRKEIEECLSQKAKEWEPDFTHEKCRHYYEGYTGFNCRFCEKQLITHKTHYKNKEKGKVFKGRINGIPFCSSCEKSQELKRQSKEV